MREPWQLFQELTALLTRTEESFAGDLAQVEEKLGAAFIANLTLAMGGEAAFAVNGFSASGPRWVMAALAYNPAVIDSSLRTLVDTFNAELDCSTGAFVFDACTYALGLAVPQSLLLRADQVIE